MKSNILNFFAVILWGFALIGNTGYLLYLNFLLFAVVNVLLAAEAFPFAKKCFDRLTDKTKKSDETAS